MPTKKKQASVLADSAVAEAVGAIAKQIRASQSHSITKSFGTFPFLVWVGACVAGACVETMLDQL